MNSYIRDFETRLIEADVVDDINICKFDIELSSFKLFHNNIRSIDHNFDELLVLLRGIDFEFDCIVLTESFKIWNIDLYRIPGYNIIYNEGSLNKNDGVVVLIKCSLNYSYKILDIGDKTAV